MMQIINNKSIILMIISFIIGANAFQNYHTSPVNLPTQEEQNTIEQIILSYIRIKNLNITPHTLEYSNLMKGILLSEYPDLSYGNSVFVNSEEIRNAIFVYAWEHMTPMYEGSQFDPRNHPDSNVQKLGIISGNQTPQLKVLSSAQDRALAIEYAYLWSQQNSMKRNPLYPDFGSNDCTNFISQAMFSGHYQQVGSGDGCEQESNFYEWYVNANPNPPFWCTGNYRNWEWSTTWSIPADFREFFAHRSSYAIEIGYTDDPATAAYFLNPGDVVQLMSLDGGNWYTYHTMIVTNKDSSGLYVTYHSGANGLDVVDRPLAEIATSPTNVYMLVQMFPEKLFLPLVLGNSTNSDQIISPSRFVYPAPGEYNPENSSEASTLVGYPVP